MGEKKKLRCLSFVVKQEGDHRPMWRMQCESIIAEARITLKKLEKLEILVYYIMLRGKNLSKVINQTNTKPYKYLSKNTSEGIWSHQCMHLLYSSREDPPCTCNHNHPMYFYNCIRHTGMQAFLCTHQYLMHNRSNIECVCITRTYDPWP